MADKETLLREVKRRGTLRRLFTEYWTICDSKKPLGPENRGAYDWQVQFHNAGKMHPERMIMAGNRVGKCVTYQTLIDTPHGQAKAGDLRAGDVIFAWDGRRVPVKISETVCKPPEPICRILLSNGALLECALDHRLLLCGLPPTLNISYARVRDLLESFGFLPATNPEPAPLTRGADVPRCFGRPLDSRGDYPDDPHLCGGQPLFYRDGVQEQPPSQGGVLVHNHSLSNSGGPYSRYTDSHHGPQHPLSNKSGALHFSALSGRLLFPKVGTGGESYLSYSPEFPPPATVANLLPLSVGEVAPGLCRDGALLQSQYGGYVSINSIEITTPQPLYDFVVPGLHNYCAAGVVHHNTQCAAAEVSIHTTGHYPPWWTGRKFDGPNRWWTGSESSEQSRDIVQMALLGPEGSHGTGWIPAENIADVRYRQSGIPNTVDQIYVRHAKGGLSVIGLKTYEQKRAKWQGAKLHGCWMDEESPQDIFTEAQTRLIDLKGLMLVTFTPMYGQTELVRHFVESRAPGIYIKNVTWDDAPHLAAEDKERLWQSYPEHERKTRTLGVPMMGSGGVFQLEDSQISCEPFEIPHWFPRINGVDFGIDHPAAGAFCAIDRDSDTFYVYDCYKASGETPVYHASAMKKHGDWIPHAWPHDGIVRDKGAAGEPLKNQYRKHGLFMLRENAQYPDARGNAVEPSVIEMLEYMRTGRFKVFSTLREWFEEKRMYHRKDGVIVKKNDDILSATRYAFMMRRYALTKAMPVIHRAVNVPKLGQRHWRNS